jgi:hypothetical protein
VTVPCTVTPSVAWPPSVGSGAAASAAAIDGDMRAITIGGRMPPSTSASCTVTSRTV